MEKRFFRYILLVILIVTYGTNYAVRIFNQSDIPIYYSIMKNSQQTAANAGPFYGSIPAKLSNSSWTVEKLSKKTAGYDPAVSKSQKFKSGKLSYVHITPDSESTSDQLGKYPIAIWFDPAGELFFYKKKEGSTTYYELLVCPKDGVDTSRSGSYYKELLDKYHANKKDYYGKHEGYFLVYTKKEKKSKFLGRETVEISYDLVNITPYH